MNQFKTFFLMLILTVLLVLVGSVIGGRNGAIYFFIFAALINFVTYWFSDKIVLRMYGAKEVSQAEAPELYQIIGELTNKASLPMPKVYMMDNDTPNAFATGRNPEHAAVAVTTGILRILSKEELMGVVGHELSHIKHRDILISTIAATIAGAITMLARVAQWGAVFGGVGSSDDEGRGGNVLFVLLFSNGDLSLQGVSGR
jgi:heat shock protein HtpX